MEKKIFRNKLFFTIILFAGFMLLSFMKVSAKSLEFTHQNNEVKYQDDESKYKQYKKEMISFIKKGEADIDVSKFKILTTEIVNNNNFFKRFFNENPRFFYVKIKSYIPKDGYIISLKLEYSKNAKKEKAKYEKKINSILKQVDKNMTDFEKVLFVNDYLVLNCAYDETLKLNHNGDVYGVLVNGKAICEGYARAFMDLMDRLNVPCKYISSNSLNHAWNMVKVDGKWYHIDVTFNDPVPNQENKISHKYFLKSADYFSKNGHKANDYFVSGTVKFMDANSTLYDNFFWNKKNDQVYLSGKWYLFDEDTGNVDEYIYNKSKKVIVKKKTLFNIDGLWPIWGSEGGYYGKRQSKIVGYKNCIYYSTPNKVYCYNLKTKKKKCVLTTNKKYGYIYGLSINNDKLKYVIKHSPTSYEVILTKSKKLGK